MRKGYNVLLFYLMLSFLAWGLPLNFNLVKNLNISEDPAFYLWSLKWWPYAISHGINPFLTKAFWAPFGQNIAWTTSCPTIAILLWPITELTTPVFSYNIITIISLTMGPYGIYLICRELHLSKQTSIFGSLVFFFSSYLWAQLLDHLNLDIVFIVILLIYVYILRFKVLINRTKYILFLAFLLALQFGISNEIYATFLVFSFIAFIVLYILFLKDKQVKSEINKMAIDTAAGIILSAALLSPYIYFIFHGYISENLNSNSFYVTDPLNFFIPTPVTLLFGRLFLPISSKFAGNLSEEGAYLGLPIIFIVVSFIYMTFKLWRKENKFYTFLSILFIITVIFSAGPYLRILNQKIFPMPWILFSHLPLIKQALPTRFTLYTSISVSIIAAIWVDKIRLQRFFKYLIMALAILFIFPNLKNYTGAQIEKFCPKFISSGDYRHYIKKNENIIILPAYQAGGALAPLWQYKTKFYFNLSQLIAGPPPKHVISLTNFFAANGLFLQRNISTFYQYLILCKVSHILISSNNVKLIKRLNSILNIKPLIIEGVVLYRINQQKIKLSLKEFISKKFKKFSNLFSSSTKFLRYHNNISYLYPQYLEKHGYLDKSFGYCTGPAINWTQNGGWIGRWNCPDGKGKCFGVGLMIMNIDSLKYIIEKYKSQAVQIFFPYPKIYTPNKLFETGQLLMIFKAPNLDKPEPKRFP